MDFIIANTFSDSLASLMGDEQKSAKITVYDLQQNPSNPGMKLHRLDKVKDKNFWSVRVGKDLRLIVHKTQVSLLLCYVGHHDKAYKWAQSRLINTHPTTGAAQLVEIRETVQEITMPIYTEKEEVLPEKPMLFADTPEEDLLNYGVPAELISDVRQANEDTVLNLVDYLPGEAAEALYELALGIKPQVAHLEYNSPFDHPDAKRRFRVMNNVEELERALDFPWEKWTVFLHPAQSELVERDYSGPARVSGSAGTGKTIVALHRAVFLARQNPDARVLLTTFSDTLSNALRKKLRRLIINEPRLGERIEVHALNAVGRRLYELNFGRPLLASHADLTPLLEEASERVGDHKFTLHFLLTEWDQVVDAWQLKTWEAYRDVLRLGRKTRLPENQRQILWSIFEIVRSGLEEKLLTTYPEMFGRVTSRLTDSGQNPYDFVIVDEAQDVNVAQLRFLSALGSKQPNALFFSGDLGQRIFQQPFSWKALGVDIRGRSRTLRINYRTSHQIRQQADRLLDPAMTDVDGNTEERKGTISVFNGLPPTLIVSDSPEEENKAGSQWLRGITEQGILPHEIGIFVRSEGELDRAHSAIEQAELPYKTLDDNVETTSGYVSVCTMHLAKGLEFRVVVVMACDDEVIPLQERIDRVADEVDLEEVYNTERHLLYVACTRARDHLLVTGVDPVSEFLDDLQM